MYTYINSHLNHKIHRLDLKNDIHDCVLASTTLAGVVHYLQAIQYS